MQKSACLNRKARRREAALNRKRGKFFSKTLVNTVAAGAIGLSASFMMDGHEARAQFMPAMPVGGPVTPADPQCAVSESTVTCTGDVSSGVSILDFDILGGPYDTLNVNDIDGTIMPNGAASGVSFLRRSSGDTNINVDTGNFGITTLGSGVTGFSYLGSVSITNTGDISVSEIGISGGSIVGDVVINNTGNISTASTGIAAGVGFLAGPDGIAGSADDVAVGGNGNITINNTGDITSSDGGIYAYVYGDGNILINQTGNIHAEDYGIYGGVDGTGNVNINVIGDINVAGGRGDLYGIDAFANDGDVNIQVTGDVTVEDATSVMRAAGITQPVLQWGEYKGVNGYGIQAYTGGGNVSILVDGNVTSDDDAIIARAHADRVQGAGNVTISVTGDVNSENGSGVLGFASNDVGINVAGDINAYETGIGALTLFGDVNISTSGNIAAQYGVGIGVALVNSRGFGGITNAVADEFTNPFNENSVTIKNTGDITAENGGGISVIGYGEERLGGLDAGNIEMKRGRKGSRVRGGMFVENTVNIANSGDINSYEEGIAVGTYAFSGRGPGRARLESENVAAGPLPFFSPGLFDANDVTITNSGDITSGGDGISVGSFIYNSIDEGRGKKPKGDKSDMRRGGPKGHGPELASGIFFDSTINITNTGDIASSGGNGIFTGIKSDSNFDDRRILEHENVVDGANRPTDFGSSSTFGYNDVTILNGGDITAGDGNGIFVGIENSASDFGLRNRRANNVAAGGPLPDFGYDIFGENTVDIVNSGDITTTNGNGIFVGISNSIDFRLTPRVEEGQITTLPALGGVPAFGPGQGIMGGNDISILNIGDITTTNGDGIGVGFTIQSDGEPVTATVAGTMGPILPVGLVSYGIFSNNTIDVANSGNITVENGNGISVGSGFFGFPIGATNLADVPAAGPEFNPGLLNGNDITITNSGDITATNGSGIFVGLNRFGGPVFDGAGLGAIAPVEYSGDTVTINNSGNITSTDQAGILVSRNEGPFFGGVVAQAAGPQYGPSSVTINNSGKISGGNGFAIRLLGNGNDVINLLPGSIVDGAIDFGNGNDGKGGFNPNDIDTLNISAGVNAVIEFADNSGFDSDFESAPENINFAGGGVVINTGMGVTAVAVDATGFAGQGTFISDFTDSIFNSIDNGGTSQTSGIDPQGVQGFGAIGEENRADGVRLWGSLFGGHHNVEADGNTVEFDHDFFGLASGIEKGDVETDGVLGILGGYGRSNLSTAFNVSDTEIDSYFGGVYWKRDFGSHRIHAAFIAGATDNETTRFVNGMEAKGDFDGTFYSPSVTLSTPLDMFDTPMSISGRVSYVHLDLDGYTETGVALPLTIADRDVSIFNLRGQLNVPQFTEQSNGNTTRVNWAIGVDATIDAGSDDVTAVVAATPFSFGAETQDDTAGFVGLNIAHTTADGARTLGFNGELQSTFDGGIEATGELSAGFQF